MLLDLVVDYLTYVFIPAYALIYAPLLPSPWGMIAALYIALTGVVYFADVRMKGEDNCFMGFPAVFQMPLIVLLTFDPPTWVTLAIILVLGLAQFTWLKFVHPVRTVRWRPATLAVCLAWLVFAGWSVWESFGPPLPVKIGLAATSLWLLFAGIVMQVLPARERRDAAAHLH